MPLINHGKETENNWVPLKEDEIYSGQPNILLSKEQFLANEALIGKSNTPVGITLDVDDDVLELDGKLSNVSIVIVNFPSFADGRGFSQARLVRERLRFEGEIRAVGHIIRDQYLYLIRSGVDSIDADRATESEWKAAMEEFDIFYQPALNKGVAAYRLRHQPISKAAD